MTTKTQFTIRGPDNATYSSSFQAEDRYAGTWARRLDRWHAESGIVHCLCRNAAPPPLVIRKYPSGKLALARHPHTGPDHDAECRYFGPTVTAGGIGRAFERGVVEEDDGVYKVRLSVGRIMQEPRTNVPPVEDRTPVRVGAPKQRAMTALGLLKLVWEIAALNEYRPAWATARAKASSVAGLLLDAADNIRWAKGSLAGSLQIGPAPKMGGLVKHNKQVADAARRRRNRFIVIGRLKPYGTDAHAVSIDLLPWRRVPMSGWECARPILTEGHHRGLQRSFDRELQAWHKGAPTYAVMIVEPQAEGTDVDLVQIALMRVSPRAIPLDSGYEATVEGALVSKQRWFDKPMRYAPDDGGLPDFRLLDTGGTPLLMEVFGRVDTAYQARMREKATEYDRKFTPQGWWRWYAFAGDPMPSFPRNEAAGQQTNVT